MMDSSFIQDYQLLPNVEYARDGVADPVMAAFRRVDVKRGGVSPLR